MGCSCCRGQNWQVLYKKGEKRDKSILVALIPLILTIGIYPLVGVYKGNIFTSPYPYPLTVAMMANLLIFCIGTFYFITQCIRRGFICCAGMGKYKSTSDDEIELASGTKKKEKITFLHCIARLIHWGFFPGLFMVIFVYASAAASTYCSDNPNLCTILFRADLFIWTLVFLAIMNSPNRGSRLDWLVSFILLFGISFLMWNFKFGVPVEFAENAKIFLAAVLVVLSFGVYPIMLKKASLESSIMKVLWVQSFYAFIGFFLLGICFEGKAPWHAATDLGNYAIIWHVFVFVLIFAVWAWAIAMTVTYSDTITTALSLNFALFLGDFGVAGYIKNGYTFEVISGIGIILVAIAFLWLLKRLITLNCPDACSGRCNWGTNEEEHMVPLEEMDHVSHNNYQFGTSSYGSNTK